MKTIPIIEKIWDNEMNIPLLDICYTRINLYIVSSGSLLFQCIMLFANHENGFDGRSFHGNVYQLT